ncbi:MAG: DegV family EDD domain-containing protein [Anaerolineae bacterium]|nr:DegV family EDD domain-containing protein [Anaerolineae bacterium]
MKPTCIVTDSAVQFNKNTFPGQSLVFTIPLEVYFEGKNESGKENLAVLPQFADDTLAPIVKAPSTDKFYDLFVSLGQNFESIICIFTSNQLIPCYDNAQQAARSLQGRTKIVLIDSLTLSAGLGYLVQQAAESAHKGISAFEIERFIRSILPSIYTIICPVGLSYLHYNGFVDKAQALVNEMLGLLPIFSIENGKLIPLEKVKNSRNVIGFLQEFLDEFDQLNMIAIIQSSLPEFQESRILRDNYQREFPTPYFEHVINQPLSILFGPRTIGMILIENQTFKKNNV